MSRRPNKATTKLVWTKTTVPSGHRWPVYGGEIWSTEVRDGPGRILVGRDPTTKKWHAGGWMPGRDPRIADFPGNEFASARKAKAFMQELADAHASSKGRKANVEASDVVLAAEQFYAAQQDELDLMKRGTPHELQAARTKTKQAKERLEDMTGANRELYGAMGGGTLGAALGALTGNPLFSAVGALTGSVVGSLVARPSPGPTPPPKPTEDDRETYRGAQVIPLHRRPMRPRAANARRGR